MKQLEAESTEPEQRGYHHNLRVGGSIKTAAAMDGPSPKYEEIKMTIIIRASLRASLEETWARKDDEARS